MSSSRSDRPGNLLRCAAALALIVLLHGASDALAGYSVRVEYLDPNGALVRAEGDDASYRSFRRTIYREPKGPEGKGFEDKEIARDSFPFSAMKVKFSSLRHVRFERRTQDGREALFLLFETTTGRRFEMPASELEGAAHPTSPILEFRTARGTERIPLDPLAPAARRQGRPSLVLVEFPGNPDRRRPERPPPRTRPRSP